jgi:hypothetical protein
MNMLKLIEMALGDYLTCEGALDEQVKRIVDRVKELETALQFYSEPDCWEHDEQGVFFMAGAFDGPTMIEADKGKLARQALGGDA